MNAAVPADELHTAYETFREAVIAVPDDLYLAPMDGWSPRDTVAHLTGWNPYMIEACQDILKGKTPAYYAESTIDYRDRNAAYVAQYNTQDKSALLADLAASVAELEGYVRSLAPAEWEADHGVVHYRGGPGTVGRTIRSLANDYRHHAEEIREWLKGKGQR